MFHMSRHGAVAAVAVAFAGTLTMSACGSSSTSKSTASTPATTTSSAATAASSAATTPTTTAAAATGAASGPSIVKSDLSEYKIASTPTSVPAGAVTFKVKNIGKIKHQFTVIRSPKSAATVLSKHNPNDDIAGSRGEIATIAPGATKTLVIKHLKAGHYAIVCALPGHYQSGMYEDFTVS